MQVQRCPECGIRLKSNYCDICMKRVPFSGIPTKRTWQYEEGSSAHREEKHECISFDEPVKKHKARPEITSVRPRRSQTKPDTKKAKTAAIVIAVMSVVSSLFGMVDELIEPAPEPEYNYEAYVSETDVPQIAQTELYNDGEIVITADSAGLYYDDYSIAITISNESERDIDVSTELLSVNDFMLSSGLYTTVGAGETSQSFLTFYSYELEEVGIEQVARIAFCLDIYDTDGYEEIARTELITLETDAADAYTQKVEVSGWELYNDGSVMVLITGAEVSDYGDCDLDVYIENTSDKTISVSTSAIRFDGEEVEGFLWNTLRSGTRALNSIYIYGFEDMNITDLTQIGEISVDLHIEYMEDWYVAETVNESITFEPQTLRPYME